MMKKFLQKPIDRILALVLFVLIGLFCFSLFANIQYPLLWNDEADTAMYAQRILKYGYPKVNDGKNIINPFYPPNFSLAVNQKFDAYLYQGWGMFYFSTIGEYFASMVNNIYLKTALLRIPFAIIGMLGIIIFALSVIKLFRNRTEKLIFGILFFILELISISLVLHLREVRYYSLVIFFSACLFYFYLKYRIFKKGTFRFYSTMFILMSFLIFNTFYPLYFIIIITFGLYEFYLAIPSIKGFLSTKRISKIFTPFIPLFLSLLATLPLMFFFHTFKLTSEMARIFRFNNSIYVRNISQVLNYFYKFEFLHLVLILQVILLAISLSRNFTKKISDSVRKIQISLLLNLFFLVHLFFITRNPIYVFNRYFIILQPVLTLILLIDISILYDYFKKNKTIFVASLLALIIFFTKDKIAPIQGHIYELTHQYKGPLDYIIPFIQDNYKNPENLVIATNYEETSYMYYLDNKAIIGYVGNNLENDIKIQPDIIINRKDWEKRGWLKYSQIFNYFLQKEKYQTISFPVSDYPVNNIPDLDFVFPHLFQTKSANNENDKLIIFVRNSNSFNNSTTIKE